ncbi:hypothetical protein HNY73_014763 [Argiope bruennichi]|uniref:Uncharacterized protein n=1 Tax=Argiope bruennichi TaxID=94029 RepID=A0A8T0EUD3_ARGBR|nr:hypothetical protein HNY73_014763 [Argiope bruennichi]
MISATSLNEDSRNFLTAARRLNASIQQSPLQRFTIISGKDICLTVWKIVPFRRSFPFGTIGIILAYVGLYYSLVTKEQAAHVLYQASIITPNESNTFPYHTGMNNNYESTYF